MHDVSRSVYVQSRTVPTFRYISLTIILHCQVEILESLNHPNIIVFHGCVSSPHGTLLIVTGLCLFN